MATSINNLPPDEIRLILEWVNEPKNAVVCKSWKAATEQRIATLINGDQGYFHSKILRPFLPSLAPPSAHPKQMRFMAEVIKNVRAYCELTPNTAPLILSTHKPIETAVLEKIVTQVSAERFEQDLIKFMNRVNKELPLDQKFRPSSPSLTNAQIGDEIRVFFQNNQSAIQAITALNLSRSNLFSLPPEIGLFINLQYLNVSTNHITVLPLEIGQFVNLQWLDVHDNHITSLPPEIGQFVKLQYLNVFYNHITTLPLEIGQLIDLQYLDVSNNSIIALSPEIGQLGNLTELYVSYNNLTALPLEIGLLVNLQKLGVSNNSIIALPPEIGKLANLTELQVSHNHLTTVPLGIIQLNHLSRLNLSFNPAIDNTQTKRNRTMSAWYQFPIEVIIKLLHTIHPHCEITL